MSSNTPSTTQDGQPPPVPAPKDTVVIANTVKIKVETPKNRCTNDFLPTFQDNMSDPLVSDALYALGQKLKIVKRRKCRFQAAKPADTPLLKFRIDEEALKSKEKTTESERPTISDVFSEEDKTDQKENDTEAPAEKEKEPAAINLDPNQILNPELYKPVTYQDIEEQNQKADPSSKYDHMFQWYHPDYEYKNSLERTLCHREPVYMWSRDFGQRIFVEARSIDMGLGDIEPFFCSLALYDLKNGRRVSEFFHFDLNPDSCLNNTLTINRLSADPITMSRRCIFSLRDPHENVHLVLRVEKVLVGEYSEAVENIYLSNKPRTSTDIQKYKEKITQMFNRLSNYRSVFAYGIMPLFEYTGELVATGDIQIDRLYYMREGLPEENFIGMLKQALEDTTRKGKIIRDARFTFRIIRLEENALPANRVDPSFIPLKDTENILALPEEDSDNSAMHIKEIEEFAINPQVAPFSHFVNTMYVEPLNANIGKKWRNIAVKVELRVQDLGLESNDDLGIRTLFGKSSTSVFAKWAQTHVNYHNYSPNFMEEIKIMLPFGLTDQAHLFFSFSHITCQKDKAKPVQSTFGWSMIPVYVDNRMIENGVYSLPIATLLPQTGYYQRFLQAKKTNQKEADIKFMESGREIYKIRVLTTSTVFNQDYAISNLYTGFPQDEELTEDPQAKQRAQAVVSGLRLGNPTTLVQFLSPVLSHLLHLISTRGEDAQFFSFNAVNYLIERISTYLNEPDRCSVIVSYITYHYEGVEGIPSYLNIAQNWVQILDEYQRQESNPDNQLAISNGWFWLEILFKGMILEKKSPSSDPTKVEENHRQFASTFEILLDILANAMLHYKVGGLISLKRLNYNLALFFCDLFCVMKKSLVIGLINVYLQELVIKSDAQGNDPTVLDLKMKFYSVLFDSDYYVDILAPKTFPVETLRPDDDPIVRVATRYTLPGLLISEIGQHLNWPNEAGQQIVVDTIRTIITKHDFDERFQTPEQKQIIATVFLPFLSMIVDQYEAVKSIENDTIRRNVLICFIWVLRHSNPFMVKRWLVAYDSDKLECFMYLLEMCLDAFQYAGFKQRKEDKVFTSILSQECTPMFLGDDISNIPTSATMVSECKAGLENQISQMSQLSKSMRMSRAATIGPSSAPGGGDSRSAASSFSTGTAGGTGMSLRQMRARMAAGGTMKGAATKDSKDTVRSTFGSFGTLRRRKDTMNGNTIKNLTIKGNEEVMKLLHYEASLNEVVGRTILRYISFLVNLICRHDPQDKDIGITSAVVRLLTRVLATEMSDDLYLSFYPTLRYFINLRGKFLFACRQMEQHIGQLVQRLLHQCIYDHNELRGNAVSIIYLLCEYNRKALEDLNVMQASLTISLSVEVNNIKSPSEPAAAFLKQMLAGLFLTSQQHMSPDLANSRFLQDFRSVLGRTRTILADSLEISRQENLGELADPAVLEDLYMQMADAHNHLPEVRVTWLQKLAKHHQELGNFAEAGNCYMQIATLLHNRDTRERESAESSRISRGAVHKVQSTLSARIAENLELACAAFDDAELYEQCNQTYRRLIPIYDDKRAFDKLSRAYAHLSEIYKKLQEAEQKQSRMLGTYYRVYFFGTDFGLQHNIEYVYKMPKITRLAEVVGKLKTLYSTQLQRDIQIASASAQFNPQDRDTSIPTIQITFLEPDFTTEEEKSRFYYVDRNTKLKRFKYSVPFTKEGKVHGGITEQYKRNSTIELTAAFPCLKTRQKVISSKEVELAPIEAAMEDIQKRSKFVTQMLAQEKVDPKNLTNFLQGSILLQVNGGTKEVCAAFLNDEKSKEFTDVQVKSLQYSLQEFLDVCQQGLDVNAKFSKTEDDKKLRTALQDEFMIMKNEMLPLLRDKSKPRSRKKKLQLKGVRFQDPGAIEVVETKLPSS